MPTVSTVGMWMQVTEHGWGQRTLSIHANGKVVSLVWEHTGLRTAQKHVPHDVLESIKGAAEQVGLWNLQRDCCNCHESRGGGVDDGRRITFQFFEPGRVTDIEYWQCSFGDYGALAKLADHIYEILGKIEWVGPDGKAADPGFPEGCGGCCEELRPASR
jgi:hypothetical protein